MYKKGIFIFRRDLRTHDNSGLIEISKICEEVYCLFILDPKQMDKKKNPYFSPGAFLFMIESLKELYDSIPLNICCDDPYDVVKKIVKDYDIDLIMFNEDYTPYSVQRDISIASLCKTIKSQDVALNAPYDIKPYKVFTPYYNVASKNKVLSPVKFKVDVNKFKLFKKADISRTLLVVMIASTEKDVTDSGIDINQIQRGGRVNGMKCMNGFKYNTYGNRDLLTYESSRLSPHLKFGTISCREAYYAGSNKLFRKQLYWRDFYMQIGFNFPHVFGNNFKDDDIKWGNDKRLFKAWCEGCTGIVIVDACMNQLNTTGYMHNRGRMIVANFLTKLLDIDWRWGEKYFATKLTDYDPYNNNGGWQWSAGTGADAQPYYRIFNPDLQQKKFDPDGIYVEKWGNKNNIKPVIDYKSARDKYLKKHK
jgi:deoxyribodipyrimidine photo-lyase